MGMRKFSWAKPSRGGANPPAGGGWCYSANPRGWGKTPADGTGENHRGGGYFFSSVCPLEIQNLYEQKKKARS